MLTTATINGCNTDCTIQVKQWRRGKTIYRELLALKAPEKVARLVAADGDRRWRNTRAALNSG